MQCPVPGVEAGILSLNRERRGINLNNTQVRLNVQKFIDKQYNWSWSGLFSFGFFDLLATGIEYELKYSPCPVSRWETRFWSRKFGARMIICLGVVRSGPAHLTPANTLSTYTSHHHLIRIRRVNMVEDLTHLPADIQNYMRQINIKMFIKKSGNFPSKNLKK